MPQMVIERRSSPWQATPGAPNVRGKAPVSAGSLLGVVWKLALVGLLVLGGWLAWQKAPAIWSKIRLNADVESASVFFIRQIPRSVASEAELQRAIAVAVEDKLKSYLAYKARWYVAYGPRGDELKIVRDDDFLVPDRTFFTRTVDRARRESDVPGTELQDLSFPRGAQTRIVSVAGEPWVVIAGWSENGR